jgi:hypothetical protein
MKASSSSWNRVSGWASAAGVVKLYRYHRGMWTTWHSERHRAGAMTHERRSPRVGRRQPAAKSRLLVGLRLLTANCAPLGIRHAPREVSQAGLAATVGIPIPVARKTAAAWLLRFKRACCRSPAHHNTEGPLTGQSSLSSREWVLSVVSCDRLDVRVRNPGARIIPIYMGNAGGTVGVMVCREAGAPTALGQAQSCFRRPEARAPMRRALLRVRLRTSRLRS